MREIIIFRRWDCMTFGLRWRRRDRLTSAAATFVLIKRLVPERGRGGGYHVLGGGELFYDIRRSGDRKGGGGKRVSRWRRESSVRGKRLCVRRAGNS